MNKKTKKYSLGGAILSVFADALLPLCGLVTAIYLTRTFGPELYGTYALVVAIIQWIEKQIHALCSPTAVTIISAQKEPDDFIQSSFSLYLLLGIPLSLLGFITAAPISRFLHEPSLQPLLQFFSFEILLFALASSHTAFLTGIGAYHQRALTASVRWIGRLVFIVIFVQSGFSVYGALAGSMLSVFLSFLVSRLHVKPRFKLSNKIPIHLFIKTASYYYLYSCILEAILKLDLIMIKQLGLPLTHVGAYAAAQNFAYLPTFIFASVNLILISKVKQLERKDNPNKARELVAKVFQILFWILPLCAIIAGSAPDIVLWIYGEKYRLAGQILQIMIFASFPFLIMQTAAHLFLSQAKSKLPFLLILPSFLIYVFALILVIPNYGVIGAAGTIVTLLSVLAFLNGIVILQLFKQKIPLKSIVINCLLTIVIYFLGKSWQTDGLLILLESATLVLLIVSFLQLHLLIP